MCKGDSQIENVGKMALISIYSISSVSSDSWKLKVPYCWDRLRTSKIKSNETPRPPSVTLPDQYRKTPPGLH